MLVLSVAILCSQYEPNQPRIKNAVKAWELGKKKIPKRQAKSGKNMCGEEWGKVWVGSAAWNLKA